MDARRRERAFRSFPRSPSSRSAPRIHGAHETTMSSRSVRQRPERKRHENFLETVRRADRRADRPSSGSFAIHRTVVGRHRVDVRRRHAAGARHSPALGGAREHRSRFGTGRGRDHHPPALRPCRDARRLPAGAVPCPGIRDAVRHRTLDARRQRTRRLLGGACRGARASAVREAGLVPPGGRRGRARRHGAPHARTHHGNAGGTGADASGMVLLASDSTHYYEHGCGASRSHLLSRATCSQATQVRCCRQRGPLGAGSRSAGA